MTVVFVVFVAFIMVITIAAGMTLIIIAISSSMMCVGAMVVCLSLTRQRSPTGVVIRENYTPSNDGWSITVRPNKSAGELYST